MEEIRDLIYAFGIVVGATAVGGNIAVYLVGEYRLQSCLKGGKEELAARHYRNFMKKFNPDEDAVMLPAFLGLALRYRNRFKGVG